MDDNELLARMDTRNYIYNPTLDIYEYVGTDYFFQREPERSSESLAREMKEMYEMKRSINADTAITDNIAVCCPSCGYVVDRVEKEEDGYRSLIFRDPSYLSHNPPMIFYEIDHVFICSKCQKVPFIIVEPLPTYKELGDTLKKRTKDNNDSHQRYLKCYRKLEKIKIICNMPWRISGINKKKILEIINNG